MQNQTAELNSSGALSVESEAETETELPSSSMHVYNRESNVLSFYTLEKECPICYQALHNFQTMFPIQTSFCGISRKFKMTTCGHPICNSCYGRMSTVTPETIKCPSCRFDAHHYMKLDMENSYMSDLMSDNHGLQSELRQMSLYAVKKRKEACFYKLQLLAYMLLLRSRCQQDTIDTESETNAVSSCSEVSYITDSETFQDCYGEMESDEERATTERSPAVYDRPITSRYHLRNVLRRNETTRLEERIRELRELRELPEESTEEEKEEDTEDTETSTTSNTQTMPALDRDWQSNVNDICSVLITRMRHLHRRISNLESSNTTERLDNLKRTYELKKYETILLEQQIADLKREHMESMRTNHLEQS